MTTALQVAQPKEIAESQSWSPDQVALIKKTVFPDSTDDELKVFLYIAQRSGLDPFARQIYAVKRREGDSGKERMTIQTSIDGFRLVASRTNSYAGRDEAVFEYGPDGNPIKCKVAVYKLVQGIRCAFTATAKWSEYFPGERSGFMWRKLPETMLEKCTEAKALRMAFPSELSNIYSKEEMDQADTVGRVYPSEPEPSDGVQIDKGYRVTFGKFAKRALEEIHLGELKDYVIYLERKIKQDGKPAAPAVAEFIERAESHIAAMENGEIPQ